MNEHHAVAADLRGTLATRWLAALAALAFGLFSQTAQAGTIILSPPLNYGSAVFGGNDGAGCPAISPNCFLISSQTTGVSGSLTDPGSGSSSSASANLALGYVSATASGATGQSGYASALVWDTLIFSGASGTSAQVIVNMSGTASLTGDARVAATAVLFPASGAVSTPVPDYLLEGNASELFEGAGAAAFTPTYSLVEPFTVTFGVPYVLGISVQAYAGVSGCITNPCPYGSAGIDDPFSLTLPTGVTFSQASPITAVPEPASWTLLLAGLSGFLFMQRRRRRGQVAAV